jgi:hypothetical protein
VLKALQLEQQQRAAAAAAVSNAVRNLPGNWQQQQQHRRGGERAQSARKQQQHQGGSVDQLGTSAVEPQQQASGVEQLLLQDIPMFLEASAAGIAAAAAAAAAGVAGAGAGSESVMYSSSGSSRLLPVDPSLLQLQRMYIRTPTAPLVLASQPRITFTTAAAAAAVGTSAAAAAAGSTASFLDFSCSSEVCLPPDSLLVLQLPKVFAAPNTWLQQVNHAAAAAVSAAVEHSSVNQQDVSKQTAAAEVQAVADSDVQHSISSSSSAATAGAAATIAVQQQAGGFSISSSSEDEPLLPLIPGVLADVTGSSSSSSRGDLPCCWSAWLGAGSWLYPAAVQQQQQQQQRH